ERQDRLTAPLPLCHSATLPLLQNPDPIPRLHDRRIAPLLVHVAGHLESRLLDQRLELPPVVRPQPIARRLHFILPPRPLDHHDVVHLLPAPSPRHRRVVLRHLPHEHPPPPRLPHILAGKLGAVPAHAHAKRINAALV